MKVCIYSRVSTSEQDTRNQSEILTDWANQRGYQVIKTYEEQESAWKSGHQRELAELLYALSGWVARMESQRRSERTKAGLARVKAQGKSLGRPQGSKDKRRRKRRPRLIVV
ncbi:recombinase family protein [Chloroflexota bacterium]